MSWRDARRCAEHLDISEARFLALVRAGKFPRPSYHAGNRSPRWSLEELDSAMKSDSTSSVTREAMDAVLKKIEASGPYRPGEAARRNGQGV